MMDIRGCFVDTRKVSVDSSHYELRAKYRYKALILDTVEKSERYETKHAMDSLNNLGWCRFDDVKELLGEELAFELVAFCEYKSKERGKA